MWEKRIEKKDIEKINAIRESALSKGWTDKQLYNNEGEFKFPCGNFVWGLVCFIDGKNRIGRVTEKYIEIIYTTGSILRFYKHDSIKGV